MCKEVIYILTTHFGTLEESVPLTVSSCLIALYSFIPGETGPTIFSWNQCIPYLLKITIKKSASSLKDPLNYATSQKSRNEFYYSFYNLYNLS